MIPHSSRWNLLCITASQIMILFFIFIYFIFFLLDYLLCKCLCLPEPSVRGNTASNSTEGANLLYPFCSLSSTWISYRPWDEFSPLSFILSRSDRRNTCGIHLLKKKSFLTFLFYTSLLPSFHLYITKVKEIFAGTLFPSYSSGGVVSQTNLSCSNTDSIGTAAHLCRFIHPYVPLFLKGRRLWIKHHLSLTLEGFTVEWTL